MNSLCLHCGANEVSREDVFNVNTPHPKDSWYPISHKLLIKTFEDNIKSLGNVTIESEAHALYKGKELEGARYFGLFGINVGGDGANAHDDYELVFGLRNSHDKTFSAGCAVGSRVFVCDNLAFSGDVVVGRKHTLNIESDLPRLVNTAVSKLMDLRVSQEKRITAYKDYDLTDKDASHVICEAYRQKAINPGRMAKVLDEWHTPSHDFGDKRAWRLFNAFTESFKGLPVTSVQRFSQGVHGILDRTCGLIKDDVVVDAENWETSIAGRA